MVRMGRVCIRRTEEDVSGYMRGLWIDWGGALDK